VAQHQIKAVADMVLEFLDRGTNKLDIGNRGLGCERCLCLLQHHAGMIAQHQLVPLAGQLPGQCPLATTRIKDAQLSASGKPYQHTLQFILHDGKTQAALGRLVNITGKALSQIVKISVSTHGEGTLYNRPKDG
jgi:hypothetical protein